MGNGQHTNTTATAQLGYIRVALRCTSQGGMVPFASDGIDPRTVAKIGNSGCESLMAWRRMALYPCSPAITGPCFRHNSSTSFCTPSSRSQLSGDTIPRLTGPSATGFAADFAAAALARSAACSCLNSGSSYTDGYKLEPEKMPDGGASAAAAAEAEAVELMATTGSDECNGSRSRWNRGSTHEAKLENVCCESRRS